MWVGYHKHILITQLIAQFSIIKRMIQKWKKHGNNLVKMLKEVFIYISERYINVFEIYLNILVYSCTHIHTVN